MTTATERQVDQEFKLLALDLVVESKTNPRKTFDTKGMEDLAASVREKGVIVPLLVRPAGAQYEVVAGARRLRAAKKVGLDEIPAIIRDLSDDQALEAQVIENLQRADVHPLEEAEGYQALLKRKRHNVESLAAQVGKSISYIWQRLKLAELIPPAKKAFLEGAVTAGHAILIARLGGDDQAKVLQACTTREYSGDGPASKYLMSVRDLTRWIENNVLLSLRKVPWKLEDAELLPKAGPCSTCPKRTGAQPALFEDLGKDTCTDSACFNRKHQAFVSNKVKAALADHKGAIRISSEYSSPRGSGALGRNSYEALRGKAASKSCPSMKKGVFIDGNGAGDTVTICAPKDGVNCKAHGSYGYRPAATSPAQMAKEKAQRKRELLTQRIKAEVTRRTLTAIAEKVKGPPAKEDLASLLDFVWDRLWHDVKKPFAAYKNWSGRKQSYSNSIDYDDAWKKGTKDLSDAERWSLLAEVQHSLCLGSQWQADFTALNKRAAALKIDTAAIRKAVTNELTPKKKPGQASPKQNARQAALKDAEAAVEEVLGPVLKASKKKYSEPTCGRCKCTEGNACEELGGGCSWVVLDRSTNHGLCSSCVTVEELNKLNKKAKDRAKKK